MTKIETNHVDVKASKEEVFNFLADFNNFEKLLPADRIENWESDTDKCTFRIKGMADIGMEIKNRMSPDKIEISSYGKVPFPFQLNAFLNEENGHSNVYLEFNGEINAFMKMMVEKPLTNFFNMVVAKLAEEFE